MRVESRAGAIKYVVATYSEFSLVALLTLFFTNLASQQILADSSIAFIVISYSTFLAFGFHNGAIRDGAICISGDEKENILRLELYFSAVIAVILVLSAMVFRSNFYLMSGLFIGGINHLKTSCQTVFRLKGMDNLLNALNVAWASVFFVAFSLLTWLRSDIALEIRFFGAWAGAASLVVCSLYLFCLSTLNTTQPSPVLMRKLFFKILNSSKYMFLMASGLVVVLTSDRLVLSALDASEKTRADFQYIDVLTNIYFLGMTSVLYYFTPGLLNRLSGKEGEHHSDFKSMTKKYIICLFGVAIAFMLAITIFLLIIHRFGWDLFGILFSMLTVKTLLICLGMVCNFYLAQRLERILAIAYLGLMALGLSMSFVYAYLFIRSGLLIFLPLLNAILVGILAVYLLKGIGGRHEKNTYNN
ncbi:hypothetical protein SAMN04490182_0861 [Pseudomonas cedrina]|uniref:Polysaccharide biosynthesis protein n=2 Tax=Pseudomonas cedrina TaxID=651740 RepID=A0A1V2KGS4_PSECE|nr:hypothetical protein [Pseudomonas cedrina]ONH56710.1 hypothetical protein BLL36_04860 [Pseudomonas cedrina subsp. cedrina]SDS15450.1 hypothetical protein SAMN04490182_0861 [Pseudomonas cedrina]